MRRRGHTHEHAYQHVIRLPLFDGAAPRSQDAREPVPASRRSLSPSDHKRRALQRTATSSPFVADALALVPELLTPGEVVLGEDVRARLEGRGLEPPSPQGWGALISSLIERQVLRETGVWRPMRLNRGGSRRTPEYRVEAVRP